MESSLLRKCPSAGVAHSSPPRITVGRRWLIGERAEGKNGNEMVVIDSGEPKLSPHVLQAMSSGQKNGTLRRKKMVL